jgi:glycine reductase complex component B subunit gamma
MKVLHYLNQFFAGIGGEEKADSGLEARAEAIGPGRLLVQKLGGASLVTVICGDNYAAEHLDAVTEEIVRLVAAEQPDAVVLGPAFNAGRYGLVCAALAAEIPTRTRVPAITGLYEENAALALYRGRALVVRTGNSAADMGAAMDTIARLLPRLAAGECIDDPAAEGLYGPGVRRGQVVERLAADRAVDMLLGLLAGEEVGTELAVPEFEPIAPPPPVPDLSRAKVALVTEGGLVPQDNPDGLTTGWSERWASYPVGELVAHPEQFQAIHGGYDTAHVNRSPYRLVPADVVRELVDAGRIGELHDRYYVTAGMATPVRNARMMGAQIADELKQQGVDAVIFTAT